MCTHTHTHTKMNAKEPSLHIVKIPDTSPTAGEIMI